MAIDVTDETFQTDVIDRSRELPVVVDFWAPWCGPCRALTPALEAAERARGGKVVLAKLNTDENPRTAASFRIQGIPAVKAFRDGAVTSEFVGALPPPRVEAFFDALVPSRADELVSAGDEASLREALTLEPGRADAALALARILHQRGEDSEALGLLEGVSGDFAAQGLASRIRLQVAGHPALEPAFERLDAGDSEGALEQLLAAIGEAEDGTREELRRVIVGVLDELGPGDPRAAEYRRKLSTALY